jgi:hypothetical protein
MGHLILMESLNPVLCLKALYPYTGNRAKVYASVTNLIAPFFQG